MTTFVAIDTKMVGSVTACGSTVSLITNSVFEQPVLNPLVA